MNTPDPAPTQRNFPEDEIDRRAVEIGDVFVTKLREAKLTDMFLVLTSIGLVIVGVSQALVAWESYRDTTPLVGYAKDNTAAAQKFADNAEQINRGVADAVQKLQGQVDRMEASRLSSEKQSAQSLNATIDDFRRDQRAWIGNCGVDLAQFESGKPIRVILKFCNTGKTPANHVVEGLNWMLDPSPIDGPTKTDIDGLYFVPGAPIPPQGILIVGGGGDGGKAAVVVRQTKGQETLDSYFQAIQSGAIVMYWFGRIEYRDAFEQSHETQFCVFLSNPKTRETNFCRGYNEMD